MLIQSHKLVQFLVNNAHLIYKVESVCVCVCVSGIEIHTVGPILTKFCRGPNFTRARSKAMFRPPRLDPRGQGAPKQGLESIYSRNHETRKKIIKQKL